ncbi:rRNA maturation RNase YbeY [Microbulbifer sp. 2205BS26-8]|uniref:rRNA maturation RNase YbeY n=1 Tax=Microbulbifer sp. 2205BS26-8 TaxID=3064386 RepID=UPI00273D32C4|nr:rRNA maturation RNase YbeY [Microbulbifer sp. 2205BS26-8]MDP5209340.1 rRNA maturation RNase YbeY [Microbulbifer sp. 2205BS26-8]
MIDLTLDVQRASRCMHLPSNQAIHSWVAKALTGHREVAELSVRIVDRAESQQLNSRYRGRDAPTNVLSFQADLPAELNLPLLGDLVICAPVVQLEAEQQHKSLSAHWAHMTVHGTLHLLGYDHVEDANAAVMEKLEADLLASLGFSAPYAPAGKAK